MSQRRIKQSYRPKRSADRPRAVALSVLEQIEQGGAFANLILPKALRAEQQSNSKFSFRDSAFTSELVYGTLRQRGYLDTVLARYCSRPLSQLDPTVLEILRLGAYQLLFMRVPDHAAVAESVDLAREATSDGPAKMVNAVLRSITRATEQEIDEIFDNIPGHIERIAAKTSHPQWVAQSFADALAAHGRKTSDLERVLQANNKAPAVNLVARPNLISRDELLDESREILEGDPYPGNLTPYSVFLDGGDPAALPSIRSGHAAAQDQGSQLAAILLVTAPLEGSDERWLDLCAGPGGKTALLASLAPKGTTVVANEINPKRARLVERSTQALDNVDVVVGDGRHFAAGYLFDRVLVDAPCSGLGSLRRRPESRWRHHSHDLDELLPLQRDLFQAGIRATRPGGVIAWVTCTPQVEETLDQVDMALSGGEVELIDARTLVKGVIPDAIDFGRGSGIAPHTVQLWPDVHNSDAMFIALLRKVR